MLYCCIYFFLMFWLTQALAIEGNEYLPVAGNEDFTKRILTRLSIFNNCLSDLQTIIFSRWKQGSVFSDYTGNLSSELIGIINMY